MIQTRGKRIMPHSSGGGSHSGGSHGGYHRSSGRSSYRSHSDSYSRRRRRSQRYVYYRNNIPKFFETDSVFKPGFSIAKMLVCILLLAVGVFMISKAIPHVPKYSDRSIIVRDEVNVISDKKAVISKLEEFQEKTGITPAIITIPNETWMNGYTSIERYAYYRYLAEFSDEMHWLIVYSQPDLKQEKRMYWYWEGMQGDYTDGVLTSSDTSRFNTVFNSYLGSNESFDDAVIKSFAYITDNISMSPDPIDLIIPVAVLFFAVILTIITIYKSIKYRNASPAPLENDLSAAYSSSVPYSGGYNPANARSTAYTGTINSRDLPDEMPSLDAIPSAPHHAPTERSVNCQYCGCSFTDKYSRCPFCNAKR